MPKVSGDALLVLVDDKQALAMLSRLEQALTGPSLHAFLMAGVEPYLRSRAKQRFDSEGDKAVGGKWAPLKPYTQRVRVDAGYGPMHPINKRTGALESYITQGSNEFRTSAISAALLMPGKGGTKDQKKAFETAQIGRRWPLTAPRPVLALDQQDMIEVMVALGGFITSEVRRVP